LAAPSGSRVQPRPGQFRQARDPLRKRDRAGRAGRGARARSL